MRNHCAVPRIANNAKTPRSLVTKNKNAQQKGSNGISRCQVPPGVDAESNAINTHKAR